MKEEKELTPSNNTTDSKSPVDIAVDVFETVASIKEPTVSAVASIASIAKSIGALIARL